MIAGDASDNHVLVTTFWRGTLVYGLDETTVNGDGGDFFFIRHGDIFCELGSGNDTLKVAFLGANTVDCDLGEGDDELKVLWSWINTLTATGGNGTDSAVRQHARIKTVELDFESDVVTRWWRRWVWGW